MEPKNDYVTGVAGPILICILYWIVGVVIAIPYQLLAGWDAECFSVVAMLLPISLCLWFVLAMFAMVITESDGHKRWIQFKWKALFRRQTNHLGLMSAARYGLWILTVLIMLPIIIHWSAKLLGHFGHQETATIIDSNRYSAPIVVVVAIVLGTLIVCLLLHAWESAGDTLKKVSRCVLDRFNIW